MKPIKRETLDRQVAALFRQVDNNGDGLATLDEFRAVVGARRDALIRVRFAKVDVNQDGTISSAEFIGWQRSMGSAAASEDQPILDRGGIFAETIAPEPARDFAAQTLNGLIEPLTAIVLVNANSNYDAGTSLEELLLLERKRFDAVDLDRDEQLSPDELQRLRPRRDTPGTIAGVGGGDAPDMVSRQGPPPMPPGGGE